jgi:hypothetical protein
MLVGNPANAHVREILDSLEGSLINSYDQTFLVMLGLLGVAFVFVLFLKGRLPKGTAKDSVAPPTV